ncbi:MAG TPA: tRNA (adenosine(37)-N6)-threonylcarbamoyltransferase complex transferase subunit TsaD [Longimicrobiales bacterium]|nr:tRNA (adenosine(37)-N6)-threonylcarbamoyltransferase complex transferase subunit TsaD [Longimicrobiales bacterium]
MSVAARRGGGGDAGGAAEGRAADLVLGVETSCDETSAAVLGPDDALLGHVILTQDEHRVWGGVVPEIASRAHLRVLDDVVDGALSEAGARIDEIDLFGVTAGPGLIGALLVGVEWTKAAAWALSRPVVGVHHMEGHLFAAALSEPPAHPPFVALLVSGGHTQLLWVPRWGSYRLLGQTRDDAAGEAFDKVARLLDLPFPGGAHVERLAASGDPAAFAFPRPMTGRKAAADGRFDFSFSGLKTAVALVVEELRDRGELDPAARADVAASFQAAVIDVLVEKSLAAVRQAGCRRLVIGGGVAASAALRGALTAALEGGEVYYPPPRLATDNAAMIARAARFRFAADGPSPADMTADAGMPMPGLEAA